MAENTFTLNVDIQTNTAEKELKTLQKELKTTSDAAKNVGKGFGEGLKGVSENISGLTGNLRSLTTGGIDGATGAISEFAAGMGVAAGATVALVAGLAAIGGALVMNSSAMAAAADDASELADKYGISTQELAAFELIASENSGTVQGLIAIYDRLANSMDEVANGNLKTENAFRRLGIAQEDLVGKSQQQIAGIVIKNYEELGRTVQATAAVQDILGKSFRDQVPAIKAAADQLDEYNQRVEKTVANAELVEAGGRQEKAFSDLSLALKELKLNFAGFFTDTLTDAATWATGMIKHFTSVLKNNPVFQKNVSLTESFKIEIEERQKIGPRGYFGSGAQEALANAQKRIKALNDEREETGKVFAKYFEDAIGRANKGITKAQEDELRREANRASQLGKPSGVTPLPDKVAPKKPEPLTEEQKNLLSYSHALNTAMVDLDRQITNFGYGSDEASKLVNNLAVKLFETGKGAKSYETALKDAETQHAKFNKIIELTNTKKLDDSIKSTNEQLQLQYDLLGLTTEKEKERLRIKTQMEQMFANQKGGITEEQARKIEEALKGVDIQLDKISKKRIDNAVGEQMKDLAAESQDLAYQIDNFWASNRDGLISMRQQLEALYKAADPEGRGANLTEAQKARLEAQVAVIEEQRRILEQNKKIEESFKSLGSAVTDWALGTEGGIKRVKLELIKLAALAIWQQAFGGSNTLANSFFSGVMSGLSGSRAAGGPILANNAYRVGEQGPETIVSSTQGYVIPNTRLGTDQNFVSVSLYPTFNNHGTINSAEDIDQMFAEWGTGIVAGVSKTIREQYGAAGLSRA